MKLLGDLCDDRSEVGWSMKGDGLKGVTVSLHDASNALAKGILRMAILNELKFTIYGSLMVQKFLIGKGN